ncbi:hypothetical protein ASPSYDRAFT_38560 [Aspergillus sydowii CBS 593.65]|uniref:Uncharacterized protein n=1 Tax=Aspergillus sydowii CBS 593.65 TaxID=1036612 RepID=A0A1L9TWS1_9EURO|nr:uncharacterized protein ASPSYDRAFT_38560 [Aspergillus sydowii CBS 593.65]OJJ63894.1 hypothetical protein ASPSYDRAFT_38560 [Aspergillus sydowii CBS 593.65]
METPQISSDLSVSPTALPNCCLALSTPFLNHLASILPKTPDFTISIGSGSGLLETLVTLRCPNVSIEGVEVNSSVNLYIAEESMNIVSGTWDLLSRALQAKAWMFVYPREPKLINRYIETYGGSSGNVEVILWLGPRADWADYESCFRDSTFSGLEFPEEVGMAPYEMLVVARRSGS